MFLDTQLKPLGDFGLSLNYQSLTSRKQYVQKTTGCGTEVCIKIVLNTNSKCVNTKCVRKNKCKHKHK